MHHSTNQKVKFLQSYIKRNLSRWYKKYGNNITGVRIDKKRKKKKEKNYYSITFNVVKKVDEKALNHTTIIPKYYDIIFPDGKTRRIKTDVRQTGEFTFQTSIMDEVKDNGTGNSGTLGLLLKDRRDNFFGLTNYHVAAERLLQRDILSYDITRGDSRHNVSIGGAIYKLHRGTFNQQLDVAFISIGSSILASNSLPGGGRVNESDFVKGPIPPTARKKTVSLYIPSRRGKINKQIEDNDAPLNHRLMRFIELITVTRCTRGGDSGGLVLAEEAKALGIILGADDEFTYIIPYYKIHNYYPLQII